MRGAAEAALGLGYRKEQAHRMAHKGPEPEMRIEPDCRGILRIDNQRNDGRLGPPSSALMYARPHQQ